MWAWNALLCFTPLSSRPWGGSKTCKWSSYLTSPPNPGPHFSLSFWTWAWKLVTISSVQFSRSVVSEEKCKREVVRREGRILSMFAPSQKGKCHALCVALISPLCWGKDAGLACRYSIEEAGMGSGQPILAPPAGGGVVPMIGRRNRKFQALFH